MMYTLYLQRLGGTQEVVIFSESSGLWAGIDGLDIPLILCLSAIIGMSVPLLFFLISSFLREMAVLSFPS